MLVFLFLIFCSARVSGADCELSDSNLKNLRQILCASLTQSNSTFCGQYFPNVTAHGDWPNQAVYMHNLLSAFNDPSTCLNTTVARDTVSWLNSGNTVDPGVSGNFFWTWKVFQAQYYDMPRKAGTRIESPDTLGRKCWAFAYLRQMWQTQEKPLEEVIVKNNMTIAHLCAAYNEAIPFSMNLCNEVMANCFVNKSYDPSRKGTCPLKIDRFHYLGFDRENLLRKNIVKYPF